MRAVLGVSHGHVSIIVISTGDQALMTIFQFVSFVFAQALELPT